MAITLDGTNGINSSGVIVAPDGSASAPSITNDGDTNTGIYFPAADNIGFATGGTIRGRWTTDGLCFGSDTAAANALDDYEEGDWTPTLGGSTTDPSVTYAVSGQQGKYIKIGSLVWCYFFLATTARSGGTGSAKISGLPFTPVADEYPGGMMGSYANITLSASSTGLSPRVQSNSGDVYLFQQTSISRGQSLLLITGWDADAFVFASIVYRV